MISIFLIIIVVLTFFYFGKAKRRWDIARKIPGPKGVPIFGYIKFFTLSLPDLFAHLVELQKQYNGYYKTWLLSYLWVIIYEPKLVDKILTNQKLLKAYDYKYLKPWLGEGLLTNEGKSWHARRKAITPAFHFNILEDFIEVFARQADVLVTKLRNEKIDDIMPHLVLTAFDIICETAMGIRTDSEIEMKSTYISAVKNICHTTFMRMFNPLYESDFLFSYTKHYKPYCENLKIAHETTQKLIEKRRKQINEGNSENSEKDELGRRKKMAFLDILLKTSIDGKPLTDDEIREEVNTFAFAGHDTTSTTLGFLLYNIAKHSEIQHKLSEEIFSVFGGPNDAEINMKRLNELKYLDLVMKESMRLYTTVPFIGRELLEECEIGGVNFPENTNLSIWVYGLCHREDIFPEPEKFIPERFKAENNAEKLNPYAYIPFSAGYRNCIGQKFAIYQIKTMIVKILQYFEVKLARPEEELKLVAEIVLKTQNGIHLKFKEKA